MSPAQHRNQGSGNPSIPVVATFFPIFLHPGSRDAVRTRQLVLTRAEGCSDTAVYWPQKAPRRCSWSSDRCTTPRLLRSTRTVSGKVVERLRGASEAGRGSKSSLAENEICKTRQEKCKGNWGKKKHDWTPPPSVWSAVLQLLTWHTANLGKCPYFKCHQFQNLFKDSFNLGSKIQPAAITHLVAGTCEFNLS